jgi:hypothetical protein
MKENVDFPVPAILNPVSHVMVNGKTTWYAADISAQLV